MTSSTYPRTHLRISLTREIAFGPGKAALLEAIGELGSIAAAGRKLNMSYKRAWTLVEAMNRDFAEDLVSANRGGREFGGASLTESGRTVLSLYRDMSEKTDSVIHAQLAQLRGLIN
ncbi:MAG: LysR family transcriptional regulator [Rhizobiaceae bacterium]